MVGEVITVEGGYMPSENVNSWYTPTLPSPNMGPYWIVGKIK
jgi:hypothetical protein